MLLFFALTLFTSATLLFLVQPMFAKMVLPLLGGTPQVWNTCMVFYQAVLLLGYLYAHFATRWLGTRRQAVLHLFVLALPWLVLPFGAATLAHRAGLPALVLPLGSDPSLAAPLGLHPAVWLLVLLGVSVGLPFFVVSTSAPMLQAWFSQTGHPAAKDPYFLYGASNLGSMIALVAYPFVIEPRLPLLSQSMVWAVGFGALTVLTLGCAVLLWRSRPQPAMALEGGSLPASEFGIESPAPWVTNELTTPTLAQRLRWLGLSFVPSSLLLGVTTFISTDLAAVPLLWVIPLALYLLTFVLVFARKPLVSHRGMLWLQPFAVVVVAVVFDVTMHDYLWLVILLHLAMFFISTLVCHGELARSRPAASHLTEFYIWMSLGGVLGGLFNALIAPMIFDTVLEYPLMIAVACMFRPWPRRERHPVRSRWFDLIAPIWLFFCMNLAVKLALPQSLMWWLGLGFFALSAGFVALLDNRVAKFALIVTLVFLAVLLGLQGSPGSTYWRLSQVVEYQQRQLLILGLGGLAAFAFLNRPVRFGLAIGAVLLVSQVQYGSTEGTLRVKRSFFGVLRVYEQEYDAAAQHTDYPTRVLSHGSTNHGIQSLDPELSRQPLSYYHHAGPLGRAMALLDPAKHQEIAVIGLGTGSAAAYAADFPDVRFTYFEIDPDVIELSVPHDGGEPYFTYIRNAREEQGATVDIDLGDARLMLEKPRYDGLFDLIAVDAFSSDAIPAHLLTREAMQLYLTKLKPDGILMVHISNRHLDLEPVVGNLAADLGLHARVNDDESERQPGQFASTWVMVVRDPARFGALSKAIQWREIPWDDEAGIWTDDFSNILGVSRAYRDLRDWLKEKLNQAE